MVDKEKIDSEKIIKSLKESENMTDVRKTLDKVQHLTTIAKKAFLNRLTCTGLTKELHLVALHQPQKFHVLDVTPTNDIITDKKPSFKVTTSENHKTYKVG